MVPQFCYILVATNIPQGVQNSSLSKKAEPLLSISNPPYCRDYRNQYVLA